MRASAYTRSQEKRENLEMHLQAAINATPGLFAVTSPGTLTADITNAPWETKRDNKPQVCKGHNWPLEARESQNIPDPGVRGNRAQTLYLCGSGQVWPLLASLFEQFLKSPMAASNNASDDTAITRKPRRNRHLRTLPENRDTKKATKGLPKPFNGKEGEANA